MKFWTERFDDLRTFARSHEVLHLGPGRDERFGVTVDVNRDLSPDVVHDLNKAPYPFETSSFDAVYAFSVIEHIDNFFDAMSEIHRVLKPGGFVVLLTPHFSDAASYIDPSHRTHLSASSFDYFIEGTAMFESYGFYTSARFRIRHRLLMLQSPWRHIPFLQSAANRWTNEYERLFCYLVRAGGLYFELEAVK